MDDHEWIQAVAERMTGQFLVTLFLWIEVARIGFHGGYQRLN